MLASIRSLNGDANGVRESGRSDGCAVRGNNAVCSRYPVKLIICDKATRRVGVERTRAEPRQVVSTRVYLTIGSGHTDCYVRSRSKSRSINCNDLLGMIIRLVSIDNRGGVAQGHD